MRLAGDHAHIEAFVKAMRLRQYLLYAVRKWMRRAGAGEGAVEGIRPERPSATYYNMSFVRYHCANGNGYRVVVGE